MKHIIVTGGSRGLGLALVTRLLETGHRVSTCSRELSPEIEVLKNNPSYSDYLLWDSVSVSDAQQVDEFVEKSVAWAGTDGIYGLVNNAGIAGDGILATYPVVDADRIIQNNLNGSLYLARAVLRHLLRQSGGGRIINISSIIGIRGYTGLAAYSASKAGMDGLTRALAREVGRRKITVNSVAPGYLETQMSASLLPPQRAQIMNRTPLGRLGTVDDVVPVICFLLSDDARFISGQTIVVDGGISC